MTGQTTIRQKRLPPQADSDTELAELEDRWRRALADLDNLRKRYARELDRERATERARVAGAWLPVVDNLERALGHAGDRVRTRSSRACGRSATRRCRCSSGSAIRAMRRGGVPFDPQRHEVVGVVDRPGQRTPGRSSRCCARATGKARAAAAAGGRGGQPTRGVRSAWPATTTRSSGVSRDATADEIQQAYRKLARKYHPDVNKDPAAEDRFKEVYEAYHVLSDPEDPRATTGSAQDFRQVPEGWEERVARRCRRRRWRRRRRALPARRVRLRPGLRRRRRRHRHRRPVRRAVRRQGGGLAGRFRAPTRRRCWS